MGSLPAGELAGELGCLRRHPGDDTIPVWITREGRLSTRAHTPSTPRPPLLVALRWAMEPLVWGTAGRPALLRAVARRLLTSARCLVTVSKEDEVAGEPVGHLHPDGWPPLYSARHPVTGDQLLSTSTAEVHELGYTDPVLLGYLVPGRRVTGEREPAPAIPWARRFGQETPSGVMDHPQPGERVERESLWVSGWALFPRGAVGKVEVFVDGSPAGRARIGLARPDVAAHAQWLHLTEAPICGFEHRVPPASIPEGDTSVTVSAVVHGIDGLHFSLPDVTVQVEPPRDDIDRDEVAGLRRRVERLVASADTASGHGVRILAFTHSLDYGGAQRYFFELLRRLAARTDVSCTVVAQRPGPYGERLEALGFPVNVTAGYGLTAREYEGNLLEVAGWVSDGGFDLAFVNSLGAFHGVDLATRLGIPSVWAIHESFDVSMWWAANFGPRAARSYARERCEAALRDANALIFASDATRRLYEGYGRPARLATLPYGLELGEIAAHRQQFDAVAARRRWRVPESATVVLCLGTIEPRKAQTVLTKAFALVADRHPAAVLAHVGGLETPYTTALREYVARAGLNGRVRVVSVTHAPYDWHAMADVFALVSDIESSPISLIEAMAFETPALATRVFGVPELIEDGRTGYLCEHSDVVAVAGALDRVLNAAHEERVAVGRAAAARVRERHDLDSYARKAWQLLEELARDPEVLAGDLLAGGRPTTPAAAGTAGTADSVSVLIPTLNAGPGFERVLDSIRSQDHEGQLELVVVDSGSSDRTTALAREHGARVEQIAAAEFNHGRVRNHLAELAAGEVLLMMVQDATLAGRRAIPELLAPLQGDQRLAAVSARQLAGPDADLFSKYQVWLRHGRAPNGRVQVDEPRSSDAREEWANSLLDNVCVAIRRSVWEELRFRELDFGEDIDFGLRAWQRGWRSAFSRAPLVEHHHSRDAAYALSRSAVHRARVGELLGELEPFATAGLGLEAVGAASRIVLEELETAIERAIPPGAALPLARGLYVVSNALAEQPAAAGQVTGEIAAACAPLDDLSPSADTAATVKLRELAVRALRFPWLVQFALAQQEPVPRAELHSFLAKLVASTLGRPLGDELRARPDARLARTIRDYV